MGDIVAFRNALQTKLQAALTAASYPLPVGGIVIGTAAEFEQTEPPRIILDPTPGDDIVPAEYYSGSAILHTDERAIEGAMRTPFGDNLKFMVHIWAAAASTTEPGDDYDLVRKYFQQVVASMQAIVPGAFDQKISAKYRTGTNLVRKGRWLTFNLTLYTPILDVLLPYDRATAYASDTVHPVGTDSILIPTTGPTTGPSEVGC